MLAALVLLASLGVASQASAHRVNVFAVAENGVVTGEGYFGGGSKAMDCRVDILDQAGTVLASGRTGEDGTFRIGLPGGAAGAFTIVLAAGEGHRAEYRLSVAAPGSSGNAPDAASARKTAKAARSPSGLTGGAAAQEAPASLPAGPAPTGTAPAQSAQGGGAAAREAQSSRPVGSASAMPPGAQSAQGGGAPAAVEALASSPGGSPAATSFGGTIPPAASTQAQPPVDPGETRLSALVQAAAAKAVEEKLAPLRLELARLADAEQSTRVRDIVGGLGWIAGLVGLAAWFKRPGR